VKPLTDSLKTTVKLIGEALVGSFWSPALDRSNSRLGLFVGDRVVGRAGGGVAVAPAASWAPFEEGELEPTGTAAITFVRSSPEAATL